MITIKLPDVGDIAPGGVVQMCIADIERMLADQGLESTALNWIAVCDHFLSTNLTSSPYHVGYTMLRRAIERAALSAVVVDATPPPPVLPQEEIDRRKKERLDKLAELFAGVNK